MTDKQGEAHKDQEPQERPERKGARKPYTAPAWEVEEVFERAALGCIKADDMCIPGPIQS